VGLLLDILSAIFLVSGSLFAIIGGLGVLRFPDFFSRLHGGGITDTMGAGLIMLGLVFQAVKVGLDSELGFAPWLVMIKLLMILFFLFITCPTACHALARSAVADGLEPLVGGEEEVPGP
jgi:multicomponent Na+:H+ antiporter subunit G